MGSAPSRFRFISLRGVAFALTCATGLLGGKLAAQTRDPLDSWNLVYPATPLVAGQVPVVFRDQVFFFGTRNARFSAGLETAARLPLIEQTEPYGTFLGSTTIGGRLVAVYLTSRLISLSGATIFDHSVVIFSSSDGVRWARAFQGASFSSFGTGYSAGVLFEHQGRLIVQAGNNFLGSWRISSSDGLAWTAQSVNLRRLWNAPVRIGSTWYYVEHTASNPDGLKVERSSDTVTWERVGTAPFGATQLVSDGTALVISDGAGKTARSTDGVTWTQTVLPKSTGANLQWINGTFFAGGGTAGYDLSTDGATWRGVSASSGQRPPFALAKLGSLWIASAANGAALAGDLETWQLLVPGETEPAASVGTLYAGDGVVSFRTTVPDGPTTLWTGTRGSPVQPVPELPADWLSFTGGTVRLPTGSWLLPIARGRTLTSNDGRNWRAGSTYGVASNLDTIGEPIAALGKVYFSCVSLQWPSGMYSLVSSADGITWAREYRRITPIAGSPTALWAWDSSYQLFHSSDGTTWTPCSPASASGTSIQLLGSTMLRKMTSSGSGISTNVSIRSSVDGVNWTDTGKRWTSTQNTGGKLTQAGEFFVNANDYQLFTSIDGTQWSTGRSSVAALQTAGDSDSLWVFDGKHVLVSDPLTPRPGLAGVSTRGFVGTGNSVMIAGFTLTGDAPRRILLRAAGPFLAGVGVNGALADPELELFRHDGAGATSLGTSNDWENETNVAAITTTSLTLGVQPFAPGSKDAARLLTLPPGVYSVHVRGVNSSTGVALAEVFDAEASDTDLSARRVVALATRVAVKSGDGVAISGISIQGTKSKRLLLRGVGPELARYGLTDALAHPRLELRQYRNGSEKLLQIARRWSDAANATDLALAMEQAGVAGFPAGSADSAMLVELEPGAYTVQLKADDGANGTALIEVYELR